MVLTFALASCAGPAAPPAPGKAAPPVAAERTFPHPAARKIHDALWTRFFNAESRLFYDMEFTDSSQFPSPEEIAARRPSTAGWFCGMDDCALQGGWILDGLLVAHRVTGHPYWAERARTTFQGLVALGTVGKTRGFVARGFAPGRTDVYPNSSADQYTSYLYALWRYAGSGVATAEERRLAADLAVGVARLVESFGGDIPTHDLKPAIYGDTSAFTPDRACRLLQFYKAAAVLGGDDRWERRYRETVEERDRARLRLFFGPDPFPARGNVYAVYQNQAAFRLLYETENDPEIKAAYRKALDAQAASVLWRIDDWRQFAGAPLRQVIPARWRDFWEPYARLNPRYPKLMSGEIAVESPSALHGEIADFHRYMRRQADAIPARSGAARPPSPSLSFSPAPMEAFGIAMLSEDPDLKRRAAAMARPMLDRIDFARAGKSSQIACMEAAIWRAAEAGLLK